MARIAGVDIPREKRLEISLTYIFGIGRTHRAADLRRDGHLAATRACATSPKKRSRSCARYIDQNLKVEGDLRREVAAEHQAQDRDRQLRGPPAPPRSARPRSAHPHQRAHPQGPEEDRRRQEARPQVDRTQEAGSQAVAKPAAGGRRPKRRERKNVAYGVAHIKSSFNNTIITFTDQRGNTHRRGRRRATSGSRARARARRSRRSSRPRPRRVARWSTACARSTWS